MLMTFAPGGQAQASRDLARRARRLAGTMADPAEKSRLLRYAEELDVQADRLEQEGERRPFLATPANESSAAD